MRVLEKCWIRCQRRTSRDAYPSAIDFHDALPIAVMRLRASCSFTLLKSTFFTAQHIPQSAARSKIAVVLNGRF
jgi:hypothetical protein